MPLVLRVGAFDFPNTKPLSITVQVYDAANAAGQKWSAATAVLNSSIIIPTDVVLPFSSFVAGGAAGGAGQHRGAELRTPFPEPPPAHGSPPAPGRVRPPLEVGREKRRCERPSKNALTVSKIYIAA